MIKASDLFSLQNDFVFHRFFQMDEVPWQWVQQIRPALEWYFSEHQAELPDKPVGLHVEGPVYIHPSVKLPPYGSITGPAYIAEGCELRPGVFIRGQVITGRHCVLGNACEFKNCLLLDHVVAPHFNYVGDSVLGNHAHLGAGVILANLRLDQKPVPVHTADGRQPSGMRKLGALLGDGAEVGCNSSLQPGTVLGRKALVVPVIAYSGYVEAGQVAYETHRIKKIPRSRLS